MKFLQKHKDQPEPVPQTGFPKKKRKKDHAHARDDEISAYFTSVRPALGDRDVNTQAKEGSCPRVIAGGLEQQEQERSSLTDNAISSIELPADKASYLGFGTRGPRHESGSYISWPESIQAPSATPILARAGSALEVGQLDSSRLRLDKEDVGGGIVLHPLGAPHSVPEPSPQASPERFQVSSIAPANRRISRSHSFPQRTCSPQPVCPDSRVDRRERKVETRASHSSMPAAIPARAKCARKPPTRAYVEIAAESTDATFPAESSKSVRRQVEKTQDEGGERGSGQLKTKTSTSLEKLLQECDVTFGKRGRSITTAYAQEEDNLPRRAVTNHTGPLMDIGTYSAVQNIPTVRFSGANTWHPMVLDIRGPGIYEQQEQRQSADQQPNMDDENCISGSYLGEETEHVGHCVEDNELAYDELEMVGLPEDEMAYGLCEVPGVDLDEGWDFERGAEVVGQSNTVTGRGFWRPHRLY